MLLLEIILFNALAPNLEPPVPNTIIYSFFSLNLFEIFIVSTIKILNQIIIWEGR